MVGAGLFGCVTALKLVREGWDVSLFDREQDILRGASAVNQGRLHRGYHYPRSPETIELTKASAPQFMQRFPDAIVRGNDHWYAIAKDSLPIDAEAYRAVCQIHDLTLDEAEAPPFQIDNVQMVAGVWESLIDIRRLRHTLYMELERSPVEQCLGTFVHLGDLAEFDLIVDATYGQWRGSRFLQFEACEIAVITAPPEFTGQSLVVLDGDFFSLDPLPGTVNHLLYHVQHSVVAREYAHRPSADLRHGPYRSWGILDSATHILPGLAEARWERSWRTVRTVLPDVEATDARPTLVEREGNVISILSGKLDTAVYAAEQVSCLASQ